MLTASAVELGTRGNIDMIAGDEFVDDGRNFWSNQKIMVSKSAVPPCLIGQSIIILKEDADLLRLFSALAQRNTEATGLNESSSRSHCFCWLTLFVGDGDKVRKSRFQFVDLAGSEKLKDAHNGETNWRNGDANIFCGFVTNYSLMQLSTCIRDLVMHKRKKGGSAKNFSFRKYMVDLVPLLSESMTGKAISLIIVCLSQAPANVMQCKVRRTAAKFACARMIKETSIILTCCGTIRSAVRA